MIAWWLWSSGMILLGVVIGILIGCRSAAA